MTTQAPHAIRTVFALVAGHVASPRSEIRIISPDIGGGFGGKVPVYPGYVIAVAASVMTGKPVKWIEDRIGEPAGRLLRPRLPHGRRAGRRARTARSPPCAIKTLADHGYADAAANPSKFPAGLFSHLHRLVRHQDRLHSRSTASTPTSRPAAIAYRCSFRVTEAVHVIERMVDILAQDLKMDPAELRFKNFIPPEQFPYKSALGWEYDSGNYPGALKKAMDTIGYAELRARAGREARAGRADGDRHLHLHRDRRRRPLQALRHPGHQDVRLLPRSASTPPARPSPASATKSQGQGHETTYAQIVAEELGLAGGQHPGRGRRHRHGALRPRHLRQPLARPPRARPAPWPRARSANKARKIAAHLLEVSEDDLDWETGQVPGQGRARAIEDDPGDRLRRLHQPPAGHGGRPRGHVATTTRPT